MAIIVNGSSDPTSINFNGVSLTSVYARQGPSGNYVQVWPSQFTLTLTGECPMFTSTDPTFYSGAFYGWRPSDTSDYSITATGLPTTVTSWGFSDVVWGTYKVGICYDTCDGMGCPIKYEEESTLPYNSFACQRYCCRPTGTNFNCMFPNNFTGFYADNLRDAWHWTGWLEDEVYLKDTEGCCWCTCCNREETQLDINCTYSGYREYAFNAIKYLEGNNWCIACIHQILVEPNQPIKWKLTANLANGQVYKSEDYIQSGQKYIVMKPV